MLQISFLRLLCALLLIVSVAGPAHAQEAPTHSVARRWNDALLEAIRNDFARPTVHARNLFHTSIAMWDGWAAYDVDATNYLHHEKASAEDVAAARHETLSFAVYRILVARFASSPGAEATLPAFDALMADLGYDPADTSVAGDSPSALGNRIAATVLEFGANDQSNEANGYQSRYYQSVNPELIPKFPGNPSIVFPNRWQALVLDFVIDQGGNPLPSGAQPFLGPEWGAVTPFALSPDDLTIYERDGFQYKVYHDPGPPPLIDAEGDAAYRSGFEQVLERSSRLDPGDGVMLDIGPGARGNNTLGTNDGHGRALNPATGLPYPPNVVPAGDYFRVLAEFWADGPDSETPPGHWFTIANYVSDHPALVKRIGGVGPVVDDLEWDVKLYQVLAGAVHDAAIAAWGAKGWYDYVRPISAIRYLSGNGQRNDPSLPFYDPDGITLVPGRVEQLTLESVQPGERHEHLAGRFNVNLSKIAALAWRGPDYVDDPATDTAGVGWILVENWWPYQRPTFVTPPFAGYVSGHSTFSRAAAEVLTLFTGDPFFPGGYGEFFAPRNEFLVFEEGPSVDVDLQWATYRDAADETSISRIYGGIHPTQDDIPGRLMGAAIGPDAFAYASTFWGPRIDLVLDIARAKVARDGRIHAAGSIPIAPEDESGPFDPTDGARVRLVADDEEVFESGAFVCESRSGKSEMTRCRDGLGNWLFFLPARGGALPFFVSGRGPTRGDDALGPLVVEITSAGRTAAGVAERCRSLADRLQCKGGPPAKSTRKKERTPPSPTKGPVKTLPSTSGNRQASGR